MPAGISKAKGRRNSKSRRMPGFQAHPAKAGRRKVYGEGSKRKTKTFNDGRQGFYMKERPDSYVWPTDIGYCLNPAWKAGDPAYVEA